MGCGGEVGLATPQAMDGAPTFLLVLLLGTAWGFKAALVCYLVFALHGCFLLGRRLGLDPLPAGLATGDLMIAFGPVQPAAASDGKEVWRVLPNEVLDPLLRATVQASEEAIANALVAAETMTGIDGNTAYAVPHNRLLEVMRKYGRLR